MIVGFDIPLVVGALAFYAFDAGALLFADEIMLEQAGHRWRAAPGAATLRKRPFLPNLLAPHRPLLRVSLPALMDEECPGRNELRHFLHALRPFQWLSTCLLGLFFPMLPLVLFRFGTGAELLAWFAAVYACVAWIVYHAFRRRRVLELSSRDLAALAFECISCAPFAINIVRKLALRIAPLSLAATRSILDPESQQSLLAASRERVDEMLGGRDPGTPQAEALLGWRGRLAASVQTR